MADNPIRVMHVVLTMEPGGLESVVLNLCSSMDRERYQPEILCLHRCDRHFAEKLMAQNIPVTVMPKKFKLDVGYFSRVAAFLGSRRIEIVHAHSGCFFYAALFTLFSRCRAMIYTAHGLPVLNRLQDKVEDNFAAFICKRIVPVSDEVAENMKRRMPMAKSKVTCLPNGIDTQKFKPFKNLEKKSQTRKRFNLPECSFLIGTVGRLAPEKNYQMLVQAFAHFHQSVPDKPKHLVFIGDGDQRESLEDLCDQLGLTKQVTFLGKQYQVDQLLPMLDVFALSSLTEGTSISLLEAQSCAIPAVVTHVGGNENVIANTQTGFLCPLNGIEEMAHKFFLLADNIQKAIEMGNAGRQRVIEHFSLTNMAREYERMYQDSMI